MGNAQDAGPDLLMQCLATSTLCGRDGRKIISGKPLSNDYSAMNSKAVGSLLMGVRRRTKLCSKTILITAGGRPQRFSRVPVSSLSLSTKQLLEFAYQSAAPKPCEAYCAATNFQFQPK
jgi:hypothetical protein